MKNKDRDSIDFSDRNIPKLFTQLFVPTLLGMVSFVLFNVADGIFIGHGIGSNGLAAINILAPIFTITISVCLMLGVGGSVVASIHLAQNKIKAAGINMTQALVVGALFGLIVIILVYSFSTQFLLMLGCTENLLPFAKDYVMFVAPALAFIVISNIGLFIIRLDGSPKYAMMCGMIPSLLNILLDYLFIFPFGWGMRGAGIATSISTFLGVLMVIIYIVFFSKTIRMYRLKFSKTSLYLTARNIGYMSKLGFSTFLGELSVAVMMFTGNYVFVHYLGEDGVAAFSIACYCLPIVYMVNNAVAQSVQPIISYNHGRNDNQLIRRSLRLSVIVAFVYGLLMLFGAVFFSMPLVRLFMSDSYPAFEIASQGMRVFAVGFPFFSLNIIFIGFFQSIEKAKLATLFTALRGIVFLVPAFLILPLFFGTSGIWLAMPCAEILTFIVLFIIIYISKKNA